MKITLIVINKVVLQLKNNEYNMTAEQNKSQII